MGGAYNACGPAVPLAEHVAAARSAAGHTGEVVSAEPDWLREQDVHEWTGPRSLPLWLPDDSGHSGRCGGTGPTPPAWRRGRWRRRWRTGGLAAAGPERPWRSGLTDDEERSLLESLRIG